MRIPFANRFRRLAADATGLVGTRLGLLGQEFQQELSRQGKRLVVLLAFFMFATLGLMCIAAFVLTLAWQHDQLLAASATLALLFLAGGAGCGLWLYRELAASPPAFTETLAELRRDELSLRGDTDGTGGPTGKASATHLP